jgi:bifunctional DNase/RNase
MELDSRPSDAIALAVRAKVPVFAEERVFEKSERIPASPGGPGEKI